MKYSSRTVYVASALAATLIFWGAYRNRCTDDFYHSTPFVGGEAGGDKEDRRKRAERNTIKTLSAMIKHCPHSSRYIVTWSYDGEGAMAGYVSGKTVFDRKREELRESIETDGWYLIEKLTKVDVDDIHTVRQVKGDISILKRRLKRGAERA
ncbi:MAG TPA: hypothetical protein VF681_00060 [Abditibacteriaceae bacterium]|jgi:hypothetical protein